MKTWSDWKSLGLDRIHGSKAHSDQDFFRPRFWTQCHCFLAHQKVLKHQFLWRAILLLLDPKMFEFAERVGTIGSLILVSFDPKEWIYQQYDTLWSLWRFWWSPLRLPMTHEHNDFDSFPVQPRWFQREQLIQRFRRLALVGRLGGMSQGWDESVFINMGHVFELARSFGCKEILIRMVLDCSPA